MQIDEYHVNAIFSRAACYNLNGEFQKAIEDYNTALDKDQLKYRKYTKKEISTELNSPLYKQRKIELTPNKQEDCLLSPKGEFVFPNMKSKEVKRLCFSAKKTKVDLDQYEPVKGLSDNDKANWYPGLLGTTRRDTRRAKETNMN